IGVINKGEIILVEEKAALMQKLGQRQLVLHLQQKLERVPDALSAYALSLSEDGRELVYTFNARGEETGIAGLIRRLNELGVDFSDLQTSESSLEEIFVNLVRAKA